jgi:ferric-dicitrate binding protein FerR (iron transport regulator)
MAKIDSIIQKYLREKTTEEENQQLLHWMEGSEENRIQFFAEKDIWDSFGLHSNQKKYDSSTELEVLKKRLSSNTQKPVIGLKQIVQIAAVLLVTFGLGWASRFISFDSAKQENEVTMQEIFVPKGQVNQIFLADGTRIWINSETRMEIPSVFTAKNRVVKLDGEAFFEVAKDKDRPFRVELNGQQIEVLGTSFNVRAYSNSNEIETTLQSGCIHLKTGKQITELIPGEQCIFDKDAKELIISKVDPVSFSSWKDGRFEFQNEDLIEVFKVVERWYDVEITIDENYFRGMHFSGVIKRNKDANHFLELLNLSIPVTYTIHADKIQISPK